jgi:hypothetical protein
MMVTSHVLFGILVGLSISTWTGVEGLLLFSALGAVFPDLDMFFEHRKTFHRPFQFLILSVVMFSVFSFSPLLLVPAVFFLEASVHSFMDVMCNGKTMRPWMVEDERAVYDHVRGKWIRPLRFFYDGSPLDLFLSFSATAMITVLYGFRPEVIFTAFLSLLYTLERKRIDRFLSDYDRFSEFFHEMVR